MADDYNDGRIECTAKQLVIHGYYFPWGSKRIAFSSIKALQRVDLTLLRGKLRIWGTANVGYWANLDPARPKKSVGFIVDAGKSVKAFITPDDADRFDAVVRERAHLGPDSGASTPSPFL